MIEAGQIYFISKAEVGKVNYGRPGLVLRAFKLDATICYFSTKIEYRQLHEVLIETTDPDFKATGLRDSSYILDSPTGDVKLELLKGAKLLGRATGLFKKRVERWYGKPLS
jgi:hypothetical protein